MRTYLLLFLILLAAPLPQAFAATINVDSGCTLSQAITSANNDSAPEGSSCEAGSGADTIELSAHVTLTASLPNISTDITIDGNAANDSDPDPEYYIQGGGSSSDFKMVAITGGAVTIQSTRVYNFRSTSAGGAITMSGASTALKVSNMQFRENTSTGDGGAINVANGILISSNVLYHDNEGANGGAVKLASKTSSSASSFTSDAFTSNEATNGGAIYAAHPLTATYVAFQSNGSTSSGNGAAISFSAIAGSIIQNSSLIDNVPRGGAAIHSTGSETSGTIFTLRHVTVYDNEVNNNDRALSLSNASGAEYQINNSIIMGSCSVTGGSVSASGSFSNQGACLKQSPLTSSISASGLGASVAVDGSAGGYYHLAAGSPAISGGASAHCLTRDQRNDSTKTRDSNDCDAGAIKYDGKRSPTSTPTATPSPSPTMTNTPDPANPVAPNPINVTFSISNRIPSLSWTSQIGLTQPAGFCRIKDYQMRLQYDDGSNIRQVGAITADSFTYPTALDAGNSYIIRLRSNPLDDSACNSFSDWVSFTFTIPAPPPPPPARLARSPAVLGQPPAQPAQPSSLGGSSSSSDSGAEASPTPRATATLPPNFRLRGCNAHTNYTVLDGPGIGVAELAANYIAAIDIWGWLGEGCQVCIQGSGSLVFLDAANAPRVPQPVTNAYSDGGWTCAILTAPGSLVLVPGSPAPAITPTLAIETLAGCMVRADHLMNLRGAPNGEVIGSVAKGARLTAMARTSGWYQVDANGLTGWLSADYITPIGCG